MTTGAGLVVAGASLAGIRAVETARRLGYSGSIILIGAEDHVPYDRPPLSKAYLTGEQPEPTPLTSVETLRDQLGVDFRQGVAATGLDLGQRTVSTADGDTVPYDGLVIATGVAARHVPEWAAMPGVHTLRTVDDAALIRAALVPGARVVMVGAGFVGSEVCSAARSLGCTVTMIEAAPHPLERAVGRTMSPALSQLHQANGVDLRCGTTVRTLIGAAPPYEVLLDKGTRVEADLIVVGIGGRPATGWLSDSGLELRDGLVCRADLSTAAPGVYGAGDVARWPNELFPGDSMRLEHWTNAAEQGAHAVRAWLDQSCFMPFRSVPYFWSDWYGSRIQFVGVSAADDEVCAHGGRDDEKFVALYRRGDRLVGALSVNRGSLIMKYRRMIAASATWSDAMAFARDNQ